MNTVESVQVYQVSSTAEPAMILSGHLAYGSWDLWLVK